MFEVINVADDVRNLLFAFTNYIVQTKMNTRGVFVKVGDARTKQARIVDITKHRKDTNNKLQDKLLAIKLAYILAKSLRKK